MASRVPDCDKCTRLWEAYENATFKQVKAENALSMATALYTEQNGMQRLRREVEDASQSAEQCHITLAQHIAIAHSGQTLAKSATL